MGPLPVINGFTTPITRVRRTVSHLFPAIYRGPITPFITASGAHLVVYFTSECYAMNFGRQKTRCSHIGCPYHSAFEISRRSFCWSSLSTWWLSFLVIRFLGRVIPEPLLEPCSLGCESRDELMGNSMEYLSLFGGCKASICLAIFIHCAGFLANGTIGSLFHYLQGCIHPRWLAGFLPSTVSWINIWISPCCVYFPDIICVSRVLAPDRVRCFSRRQWTNSLEM